MPTTSPPDRITLRLRAWDGDPAGVTLIQGVIWDPLSSCYYVHQADDVPGRKEQAIVVRRHDAAGVYRGFKRLPDAGHGSSIGAQPLAPGRTRLWIGHATKGPGFIDYVQGDGSTTFQGRPALPQGDYSCDPAGDVLLVRSGTLYRAYKLSDAAAGKATELYRFRVADWLSRFQGHLVAGGRLYVHRDKLTKGASELRSYELPTGRKLRAWNTDPYGDEAEGAMVKDGYVYAVERVGGNNAGRTVVCVPLEPVASLPVDPTRPGGTWEVVADQLAAVKHEHGDRRDQVATVRPKGYPITTGVRFVTATDSAGQLHVYLLTEAGNRYALSAGPNRSGTQYLRKVRN